MLTPAEVLVFIVGGHLPVTLTMLGGPALPWDGVSS